MTKGKSGIIIALIVAALAAFGVIDKQTAERILSSGENLSTTVQNNNPPKEQKPATPATKTRTEKNWQGWSKTQPAINLSHIFTGEINRSGKATGFHSRPDAQNPDYARIDRIKGKKNRAGVYTAQVEIYDPEEKRWKSKFSTFFPDNMGHQQVLDSIINAWNKRNKKHDTPWRGPSGKGFQIEGYVSRRGGINTAYPIYVRN